MMIMKCLSPRHSPQSPSSTWTVSKWKGSVEIARYHQCRPTSRPSLKGVWSRDAIPQLKLGMAWDSQGLPQERCSTKPLSRSWRHQRILVVPLVYLLEAQSKRFLMSLRVQSNVWGNLAGATTLSISTKPLRMLPIPLRRYFYQA